MPEYVRIEWSGFWDFPSGNYQGGSKDGRPKSGIFTPRYIILDSIQGITYSIDPGKIAMPVSPDFSFSLKNKDRRNGRQVYPFRQMSTLGRTEEYGGKHKNFGDLFIRISIPFLNGKVIAKGVVDSFSYSAHDMEITIKCTDFIKSIKDTKKQIFITHDLGSCECVSLDNNTSSIATNVVGATINSVIDAEGNSVNFQRMTFRVEDLSDRAWYYAFGYDYTGVPGGGAAFIDSYDPGGTPLEKMNAFINEVKGRINSRFSNSTFARRFINPIQINFTGLNSDDNTNPFDHYTQWRPTFVQIEDSTILTMFRIHFHAGIYGNVGEGTATQVTGIDWWYEVEIVHANNGNSISYRNGEKYIILERGRFHKSTSNVDDADIKTGDKVSTKIIDYQLPLDNISVLANSGIGLHGDLGGVDILNDNIIHGILFERSGQTLRASEYGGFFNSFDSLMYMLDSSTSSLVSEYVDNPSSGILINTNNVIDEKFKYCYISDIIHYRWGDVKITEAIVNAALQTCCYLFSNEEGEIVYQSRDLSHEEIVEQAIEIYPEDYEIVGGNNYTYGSKYYEIEYGDQVEINNIEGSDEVQFSIDTDGEVVDTAMKPQSLDIANFRTTDLRVESGNKIFRQSPFAPDNLQEDYFIMHPLKQASIVARTISYPSRSFKINLDIRYGESKGYYDIKIGSYIIENTPEGLDIFLVKSISYNPSRIFRNSTSLELELFALTVYPTIREEWDEMIPIYESTSEDVAQLFPPTDLAVQNIDGNNGLFLTWDHPTEGDTPGWYEIFKIINSNRAYFYKVDANSTGWTDDGFDQEVGDSVTFRMRSMSEDESVTSEWSDEVGIVVDDETPPPEDRHPPTNLFAANINGSNWIRLSWTRPEIRPDAYHLQVSIEGGTWRTVSSFIPPENTTHTDQSPYTPGTSLRYRIRSVFSTAYSYWSDIDYVQVDNENPDDGGGGTGPGDGIGFE